MDDRQFLDRHPNVVAAGFLGALIGVSVLIGLALVTKVTVPLLWPAGATLVAVWLACLAWRRRRRDLQAEVRESAARAEARASRSTSVRASLLGDDSRRVGTQDRHAVLDALAESFSTGHLNEDELAERQDRALAAVTRHDLRVLMRDLPLPD